MTATDIGLCPEAAYRDSLDDEQFWDYVLGNRRPGDPADELDVDGTDVAVSSQYDPCPECGERGPCAYDAEGRPMVHVPTPEDDL